MKTNITQQELITLAGQRTGNFYHVHRLCCSEAIILVLSRGFRSTLPEELAVSIGAGFCGGMGGGESVCGALSGAIVGLGVFLAPNRKDGLSKKKMRKISQLLHDNFRRQYGSNCCKDLTANFAGNQKAKMKNCGEITMRAAEMAAEILLDQKPELCQSVDLEFLQTKDTITSLVFKKVGAFVKDKHQASN